MSFLNFHSDQNNQSGSSSTFQPEKLLFTKEETAYILSISERHLDDLVYRGEIARIKSGRKVLFPKESIFKWIQSKVTNSKNS